LAKPELSNLASDPDESYDVAPENPQIVAQMEARIAEMIQGFPAPVRQAYAEAQARKTNLDTPAGAYPQPKAQ
jgi:arylsulfatase